MPTTDCAAIVFAYTTSGSRCASWADLFGNLQSPQSATE